MACGTGVKREKTGGAGHTHSHAEPGQGTPMEELLALMQFMISCNNAHAQEPAEPADRLQTAGKRRACQRIMDTAADFDRANAQLDAVARELSEEAEKQRRSEARASDRFLRLRGLLLRKINWCLAH